MLSKIILIFFAALLELIVLEMTVGVSLPSDRASAKSTVVIKNVGTGLHFVTDNKRFSVVDYEDKFGMHALVLRESVNTDREDGVEGSRGTVTVEAFLDNITNSPLWRIQQEGHEGEVEGDLYTITKRACCDAPTTYIYFSLRDGRKVYEGTNELNRAQWDEIDSSINGKRLR